MFSHRLISATQSSSEVLGDSQSQKASPPHPASRDTVHAAAEQARPQNISPIRPRARGQGRTLMSCPDGGGPLSDATQWGCI